MVGKDKQTASQKQVARSKDPMDIHRDWLTLAHDFANSPVEEGGSPHPSSKVGAIIVGADGNEIARGVNQFPTGVDRRRAERYECGSKSLWFNCAEQIAMARACRSGSSTEGATLYVTLQPCSNCAGMAIEAGIKVIVVPSQAMRAYAKLKEKWKKSIEAGVVKCHEAGVRIIQVDVAPSKPSGSVLTGIKNKTP